MNRLEEWFEYGGKPFHFAVFLNLYARGFDSNLESELFGLIEEYQNTRSVLEKMEISLATISEQKAIASMIMGEEITIYKKIDPLIFDDDETDFDENDWDFD